MEVVSESTNNQPAATRRKRSATKAEKSQAAKDESPPSAPENTLSATDSLGGDPSRRPHRRPAPSRMAYEIERNRISKEEESDAASKQLQTTLSQHNQTQAVVQRLKNLSVAPLKETKRKTVTKRKTATKGIKTTATTAKKLYIYIAMHALKHSIYHDCCTVFCARCDRVPEPLIQLSSISDVNSPLLLPDSLYTVLLEPVRREPSVHNAILLIFYENLLSFIRSVVK